MSSGWIYHLAPASELRAGSGHTVYRPARLDEDGFVHCAGSSEVTLSVADDYFANLDEPLWVLEIDPGALSAELRFEAAAPIADARHQLEGAASHLEGATSHLKRADSFPHVYGPIDRAAIRRIGRLAKSAGGFVWPERFSSLDDWLGAR